MQSKGQCVHIIKLQITIAIPNFFIFLIHNVVHCEWDDWVLGECSKSCGGGTLTQTRQVKVESQHGGEECTGADTLEVSCNVDECPGNKKLFESMMSNYFFIYDNGIMYHAVFI